jgi:uncharacterized protein DUF6441
MHAEIVAGEKAVTGAAEAAATAVKQNWRNQIQQAGLGRKLALTIRSDRFPKNDTSLNAAGFVWSKAPRIVDAHSRGALIQSKQGLYLAIPTPAAGRRGIGGVRLTPGGWERRTGLRLRFVSRRTGPSLLVADDARLMKSGRATKKKGKRRKDGILSGAQTVPIFLLVRRVKLPKRLDLYGAAESIADRMPAEIVDRWVDQKVGKNG